MEAIELVKELARRTGAALEPDPSGACSFEADGLAVEIVPLGELDAVALSGDLGEPPPQEVSRLYRLMLEANRNFTATFGATLSLDMVTGRFALCKVLPLKAQDGESFAREVERFLNTQEAWAGIVRDWRDIPDTETPAPLADEPDMSNLSGFRV
ncbi:MAG: type III secretion system chaperone [Kiritimatiellae bacterium]|nr:type III secretion system chaperone [Kiritimatiellia bacterium]